MPDRKGKVGDADESQGSNADMEDDYIRRINEECLTEASLRSNRWNDSGILLLTHSVERGMHRGFVGDVPPLIVLWAMLRWERKLGVAMLEMCVSDLIEMEVSVRKELERITPEWSGGMIAFNFRHLDEVRRLAEREAELLQQDFVATEHVALALSRMPDPSLAAIFAEYQIDYERLKANLYELLRPANPPCFDP